MKCAYEIHSLRQRQHVFIYVWASTHTHYHKPSADREQKASSTSHSQFTFNEDLSLLHLKESTSKSRYQKVLFAPQHIHSPKCIISCHLLWLKPSYMCTCFCCFGCCCYCCMSALHNEQWTMFYYVLNWECQQPNRNTEIVREWKSLVKNV